MHLALYHPAAALRSTAIKETIVAESAAIPAALQDARARRRATTQAAPSRDGVVATVSEEIVVVADEAPIAVESETAPHDQLNLF
jgi:hypothetical protein